METEAETEALQEREPTMSKKQEHHYVYRGRLDYDESTGTHKRRGITQEELDSLGETMRTQENLATASPIYFVLDQTEQGRPEANPMNLGRVFLTYEAAHYYAANAPHRFRNKPVVWAADVRSATLQALLRSLSDGVLSVDLDRDDNEC